MSAAMMSDWCAGSIEKIDCGSHAGTWHVKPKPTMSPLIERQRLAANAHCDDTVISSAAPTPATFGQIEELFTNNI